MGLCSSRPPSDTDSDPDPDIHSGRDTSRTGNRAGSGTGTRTRTRADVNVAAASTPSPAPPPSHQVASTSSVAPARPPNSRDTSTATSVSTPSHRALGTEPLAKSSTSRVSASASANANANTTTASRSRRRRRSLLDLLSLTPSSSSRTLSSSTEMFDLAVLRNHAELPAPASRLPSNVLLLSNRQTLAIFDAYPKAKYHFLVLPRYPFRLPGGGSSEDDDDDENEDERHGSGSGSGSGDGDGRRARFARASGRRPESIIRLEHLDSLMTLMTAGSTQARREVLAALKDMAEQVVEMIRDEMVKTEGYEWGIHVGFHAVPSLKHLHLHVISDDLVSPALKNKKHYNSFRPDLGFFVHLSDVERWIEHEPEALKERLDNLVSAHALLSSPLTCFKCDEPFGNVPKLKQHLEAEFAQGEARTRERDRRYDQEADREAMRQYASENQ